MATRPLPRSRSRPQLRVVRGGGKGRRSPVPVVVVAVLAVFGVVGLQALMGQDGLKTSSLEREVAHATEQHVLLRARVAELSSPGRIADEADKLGMVPAGDPVFLKVPSEPAPAKAGSSPHTPDARAP